MYKRYANELFEIKYSDLAGRIGILHTNHGKIETPAYVPVIHPVKQAISPNVPTFLPL